MKTMKTWKVSEKYSEKYGSYLEFRRGTGDYELSPVPYFHREALDATKPLRLYSGDIGYREACRELCKQYGDDWNVPRTVPAR